MTSVSERLKKLRRDSGLRQHEVAKKMKLSQGAIAHWESGRTEPSLDDLKLLASILRTDVQFLTGSPTLGLQPVEYELGSDVKLNVKSDLMAPKIQLGDDVETYLITVVGSDRYEPTYHSGDLIYARQRGITPKVAVQKDYECLFVTEEGDKYIGTLRPEERSVYTIKVANSAPISGVKIKSVHPVVWVKRQID